MTSEVLYRSTTIDSVYARRATTRTPGQRGFVDRFIEKRLLVTDTNPHGEITVIVARIGQGKNWLAENRESLQMRDRLD
jgi:hypothetical protein